MEFFTIKPCKTQAAYVVEPKKPLHLDLKALKVPFDITARTPVLMAMRIDGVDVSLYPSGKMLIQCDEPECIAKKVWGEVA